MFDTLKIFFSQTYIVILFVLATLFLFSLIVIRFIKRRYHSWKNQKRMAHGKDAEAGAKRFLIKHGYKILDEQVSWPGTMIVDGTGHSYLIKADFKVKKKGRIALVEVKTGEKAVNPLMIDTRRQLLEYSVMYDVDDVFLLDADRGIMKKIEFPLNRKKIRSAPLLIFIFGFIFGLSISILSIIFELL